MIEKPKQYFDTRSHQLYYQWDESEYFSHQEPIYDRTREYIESLEAENAQLWELASLVSEYISHDRCEGCVIKTACNSHELDECWMTTKLRNQLRELRVEVD